MPRRTNTEKANPQLVQENARLVLGEALIKLRSRIRLNTFSDKNLVEVVSKLLPLLTDENTQTKTDVTMEMLAQKAVRVNLRIQQAGAQSLQEDVIEEEPEDETPEEVEESND